MKYMTTAEIRESFIKFFESKNHQHVPSSSLVPYNDNSLLFTNAGMVQFKDVFLGLDKRDYNRAVTIQRCVRAGGKHNDLDTVGRTARHHTFFEMMGNFSFGDYFKRDAIAYAWEYLIDVLCLPKEKLYITVYDQDDEAFLLWQEVAGVSANKIYRIGSKDNFWAMGETGPCGPCSEVFFDRGEQYGCNAENCGIGTCDCDRWMEIWNLVFMQFDRNAEGVLTPLPNPSIDTGMGLERVASVLQEVASNYDTDIMAGIIQGVVALSGQPYHQDERGFAHRVIADHARSCAFLIADGVLPSNEGRGYVLRRILRRAARFGMVLGINTPFLHKMVDYVVQAMGPEYDLLTDNKDKIAQAIETEEVRFHLTLEAGLEIIREIVAEIKAANGTTITGKDAFLLYDTYGFPLDLTKDIAEENGLLIDEEGFALCMAEQKLKSKSAQKNASANELQLLGQVLLDLPETPFDGYQQTQEATSISQILVDAAPTERTTGAGWLVLERTPFYAESGGQIGDTGIVQSEMGSANILDTQKLPNGVVIHKFEVTEGSLQINAVVTAKVDEKRRTQISRNHSATHLLHKALQVVLGEDVHQAGSLVTDSGLRFDFNYAQPVEAAQLCRIEELVNAYISDNLEISTQEMLLQEAKDAGALAYFGDKYKDTVRVLSIHQVSKELCGGTHAARTGEIGLIKLQSEAGIGSGLRRIEAATGLYALESYKKQEKLLDSLLSMLKATPQNVMKRLGNLLSENKTLQKELAQLKMQVEKESVKDLWQDALAIADISVLATVVDVADMASLRSTMDRLRDKRENSVILLAAVLEDKVQFVAAVSAAAQAKGLHAGKLIKEVASVCGGSGGGRPDTAQAGGKDTSAASVSQALEKGLELIKDILK